MGGLALAFGHGGGGWLKRIVIDQLPNNFAVRIRQPMVAPAARCGSARSRSHCGPRSDEPYLAGKGAGLPLFSIEIVSNQGTRFGADYAPAMEPTLTARSMAAIA
jgi:hypothetical protein